VAPSGSERIRTLRPGRVPGRCPGSWRRGTFQPFNTASRRTRGEKHRASERVRGGVRPTALSCSFVWVDACGQRIAAGQKVILSARGNLCTGHMLRLRLTHRAGPLSIVDRSTSQGAPLLRRWGARDWRLRGCIRGVVQAVSRHKWISRSATGGSCWASAGGGASGQRVGAEFLAPTWPGQDRMMSTARARSPGASELAETIRPTFRSRHGVARSSR
jgi:hypothetical protein